MPLAGRRVAVLVSGTGSNLRALAEWVDDGRCPVELVAVLADRRKAKALGWAEERGIPTGVVRPRDYPDRAAWDEALAEALAGFTPDLVVSAGFMRIVGPAVLARFGGRMINVHPSLLPAFPGLDAPGQAVAAGVRVSGCTVHLVDAGVDTGAILAQGVVPVHPDDDAAALHARIQSVEHRLLPQVVAWISTGALELAEGPRFGPAMSFRGGPLLVPEGG